MSLSVTFRRAARAEFIEAAAWYESQRPGLGVEFIAEIERCVDAAAERPTTYAAIDKGVRRGQLQGPRVLSSHELAALQLAFRTFAPRHTGNGE